MSRQSPVSAVLVAGLVGAVMLQCALVQTASADLIEIRSFEEGSSEGKGRFIGTIDYWFDSLSMSGLLSITLTNKTDQTPLRSYITGVAFNIDSADPDRSASLITTTHDRFEGISDVPTGGFGGEFDSGAAVNGNWLGNGNPEDGIAPGETGVFTFLISADDAGDLGASSFLEGPREHNFVVRYRGGDFSDKVPAIPGPAGLALFGLAALCTTRRRRNLVTV